MKVGPHKFVTPGVQFSPILLISSPNFRLVIFFPPCPAGGECSSGSKNGFCINLIYAACIALKTGLISPSLNPAAAPAILLSLPSPIPAATAPSNLRPRISTTTTNRAPVLVS